MSFEFALRNGETVNSSANPWFRGDVGISVSIGTEIQSLLFGLKRPGKKTTDMAESGRFKTQQF